VPSRRGQISFAVSELRCYISLGIPLECCHLEPVYRPPGARCGGAVFLTHVILNILSLETSSEWCCVAAWLDGRSLEREELAGQRHSELILPMIDALLHDAGVGLGAFDAIAFGAGPGSFTGLRIACGVAQGLGFAVGVPVACVSTLLAVAQASAANRVVVCLDARMREIYFGAFQRDAGPGGEPRWSIVHPPQLCVPSAAPPLDGGGWVGAGSGFAAHGATLAERYVGCLSETRAELRPRASDIAELAVDMVRAGLTVPAEDAAPVYIRDRVALTVDERRVQKVARDAPAEHS
jgi:tRNA threonylcarbamoyladenosine biosynthesis protein TsaB